MPLALLRYQDMAAPRCGNGERRIIDDFKLTVRFSMLQTNQKRF